LSALVLHVGSVVDKKFIDPFVELALLPNSYFLRSVI